MPRNTSPISLPLIIQNFDDFIDGLVEHAGEKDPLEEKLQEVLVQKYKGRVLHFASDLFFELNKFACECEDLITCDCLREHAMNWAKYKLNHKTAEPDVEEQFSCYSL